MKIIKIILIAIVALIALFLIAAALAPKAFMVERRIVINAPAEQIFGEVNSFQKWESWSPWLLRDATIKNTYTGPAAGVGSKTSWTSKKSGNGTMEITESVPYTTIDTKVAIGGFTPFQAGFTFNKVDSGTEVIWAAHGSAPYPFTFFNYFTDKMMGPDYESGLANLKKHVESMPKWKLGEYKVDVLPAMTVLAVLDSCPVADISKKLGGMYGEIGSVMRKNKLDFVGPVMAYYYSYSPERVVFEAAVPVAKKVKAEGRVICRTEASAKTLVVPFFGDYMYLGQAIPVVKEYMVTNHLEPNGVEHEIYVNDPTTVKSKMDIETRICFPVK